jgi:hypothetical protein
MIRQDTTTARLFTASVALKLFILVLEATEKRRYLDENDRERGPEELSGVFSQGLFLVRCIRLFKP